jgi:hypothetical protein
MVIRKALKSIASIADGWVRLDHVRRMTGGLDLCFSIHKGRRGKATGHWAVVCRGVHEFNITDFDGGGLRVYPTSHPAARQYVARRAELRWPRSGDAVKVLVALQRAHVAAVDDWIPFNRYVLINTPWSGTSFLPDFAPISGRDFICKGPDFLLRAYAKALEAAGERARFTLRGSPTSKSIRPQVLHFGESYIVADTFGATAQEHCQ